MILRLFCCYLYNIFCSNKFSSFTRIRYKNKRAKSYFYVNLRTVNVSSVYITTCTPIIQWKLGSDKKVSIDIPDGGGSKPVHATEPDPVKPNMPMIPVTRL